MQAMINPGIWYRPDSLIVMPQEDSVLWTDEYTVFTVMRSTNNESECLWSFKGNDTVSVAVLTNGFYSSIEEIYKFRDSIEKNILIIQKEIYKIYEKIFCI